MVVEIGALFFSTVDLQFLGEECLWPGHYSTKTVSRGQYQCAAACSGSSVQERRQKVEADQTIGDRRPFGVWAASYCKGKDVDLQLTVLIKANVD